MPLSKISINIKLPIKNIRTLNSKHMKLWIARDLDGELFLYDKEPVKGRRRFNVKMFTHSYRISPSNFSEVTFENSPQQVEIKLVK